MKTKFYLLGLMLGALSLSACSKDEGLDSSMQTKELNLTFTAQETALNTRTEYIDKEGINFSATEEMTILGWAIDGTNAKQNASNGKTATRAEGTGAPTFHGRFNLVTGAKDYHLWMVCPSSSTPKHNEKYEAFEFNITLANMQTMPSWKTFDPKADILVSQENVVAAPADPSVAGGVDIPGTVKFQRLFTFFRLQFPNELHKNGEWGTQIEKVTIQSNGATLAGDAVIAAPISTTGEITADFTKGKALDNITVSYTKPAPIGQYPNDPTKFYGQRDAWFVVNPTTIHGMTITIETDTKIIKQTIASDITFPKNVITAFDFKNVAGITTITDKPKENPGYFEDPNGITIDGVTYTAKNGVKVSQITETEVKTNSVMFLEDGTQITTANQQTLGQDFVLIGNDKTKKAKVTFTDATTYFTLNNPQNKVVFKNLDIDCTGAKAYVFSGKAKVGGCAKLYFEDCNFTLKAKQMLFRSNKGKSTQVPSEIVFKNCKIKANCAENYTLIQLADVNAPDKTNDQTTLKNVTFENCVIYTTTPNNVDEVAGDKKGKDCFLLNLDKTTPASTLNITFNNNICVDFGAYNGVFRYGTSVQGMTASKNIFYHAGTRECAIVGPAGTPTMQDFPNVTDNKVFNEGGQSWWITKDKAKPELKITPEASNPLNIDRTTGVITPVAGLEAYGPQTATQPQQ